MGSDSGMVLVMLGTRRRARINPGLVMPDVLLPTALSRWLSEQPPRRFDAGAALIAPDAASTYGYLLRSGLVRRYSLAADGSVFNHDFLGAGDWAFGHVALRNDQLCCGDQTIGIEALQATTAVRVTMTDLARWRQDDAEVAAYLLDTLMRLTAERFGREAGLALHSAEQRYLDLLAKRPDILESVPLRQVAAWLGITPVALSRIRKRVQQPQRTDDGLS